MKNETVSPNPEQSRQWKQIFKLAVDELATESDGTEQARKTPIAKRTRIGNPPVDPLTAQKRALAEAAAALAALWQKSNTPRQTSEANSANDKKPSAQRRLQRAQSF